MDLIPGGVIVAVDGPPIRVAKVKRLLGLNIKPKTLYFFQIIGLNESTQE